MSARNNVFIFGGVSFIAWTGVAAFMLVQVAGIDKGGKLLAAPLDAHILPVKANWGALATVYICFGLISLFGIGTASLNSASLAESYHQTNFIAWLTNLILVISAIMGVLIGKVQDSIGLMCSTTPPPNGKEPILTADQLNLCRKLLESAFGPGIMIAFIVFSVVQVLLHLYGVTISRAFLKEAEKSGRSKTA